MLSVFAGGWATSFTTIGCASVAEAYQGDFQAKMFAYISICRTLSPLLGPFLGGYILAFYEWKATFILVFVLVGVALLGM
ncbi:MFS transporter [Microbulbifer sp. 2205BS26-8]|uniref:MFS transporter n=1 Tax=Microbulbifer sp. 2205BS26-8 TaxID=3064386 RepID=UPI003530BD8A